MKSGRQAGFTLLELMISLAILSIVIGVVVEGINTMQERNTVETNKLDLTQQTREFMDQIVNDLDQAGFPGLNMFDPATLNPAAGGNKICTQNPNVSCGFVSVSTTAIQFEGDVDGTGVSEVYIQLNQPAGGCPCTIQRGTIAKPATTPPYPVPLFYTQVDNVMNTNVFTAYAADGSSIPLPQDPTTGKMNQIVAIGITMYVRSTQPDPKTRQLPTVTMVSSAKVRNIQSL